MTYLNQVNTNDNEILEQQNLRRYMQALAEAILGQLVLNRLTTDIMPTVPTAANRGDATTDAPIVAITAIAPVVSNAVYPMNATVFATVACFD
jgi:hypothetical protein